MTTEYNGANKNGQNQNADDFGAGKLIDFTAKKRMMGSIVNARTAQYFEFAINPNNMHIGAGANMAEDPTPGFSDPLFRFASGKKKDITFTLQLNGEIRRRMQGTMIANGVFPSRDVDTSLSVAGEIEFLQSLCNPTNPQLQNADGGLDVVLFSFGSMLDSVRCFLTDAPADVTMWTPDLEPCMADVHLTLVRIQDKNVTADLIWAPPGHGGIF